MGKRVADKQLTQLNQFEEGVDDNGSDHDSGALGFRRADESTLAQRVIKKPKSRLRATPAAAAADPPPASSAFSGFSGFGSSAAAAPAASVSDTGSESSSKGAFKGFSFGQPAASTTAAKPAASAAASGAFGSFGATGGSAFKMGAFGAPAAAAPTATTNPKDTPSTFNFASKTSGGFSFGSKPQPPAAEVKKPAEPVDSEMAVDEKPAPAFSMTSFQPPTAVASSTTGSSMFGTQSAMPTFASGFVPPNTAAATTTTAASSSSAGSNDDEFFKSIRGLNVSLQKRISDALDANAFVDLTPLLEQYRIHWAKINGVEATPQAPSFDNSRLGAAPQPEPQPESKAQPVPEPTAVTAPKFNFGSASSTSPSAKPAAAATSGFSFNFGKPSAAASTFTTPTLTTKDSAGENAATKTP
ncbi:hypothetical protein GGI21_005420, partial [Coemansia aciculifera]